MSPKLLKSNGLLAALLIFGSGGLVLGVFLPIARANRNIADEVLAKQQFVLSASGTANQIRHVEEELRHTREYVDTWELKLPDFSGLPALFSQISSATAASGASLAELEPGPASEYERFTQVPVSFDCRGDHRQVLELIRRIEKLQHLIWIDEFRLAQSATDAGNLECELVLTIFTGKSEKSD